MRETSINRGVNNYLTSPFSSPDITNPGGGSMHRVDGVIPLPRTGQSEDTYLSNFPEHYFLRTPNGERRLNLLHQDIVAVAAFGKKELDGKLRIRARERNAGSTEMLMMGEMPLQELVSNVKGNKKIHLSEGTTEFLLPHDYPLTTFKTEEGQWGHVLVYHDTRLTLEGILASDMEDKVAYAKGIIENFVYLTYLLGYIPDGSSLGLATHSQIPSFPLMARRVYEEMQKTAETPSQQEENRLWFQTVIDAAKYEYTHYWKNEEKFNHFVPGSQLIRPGDTDVGYHDIAECELTEDMTWEAYGRSNDFQFPRMNAALAASAEAIAEAEIHLSVYESDPEKKAARIAESESWLKERDAMVTEMYEKMWDGTSFRAIDTKYGNDRSEVLTTGQYMMMYTQFATADQAAHMVSQLDRFLLPFGLSNVDMTTIPELSPGNERIIFMSFPRGVARTIRDTVFKDRQWGDKNNPNDFPIKAHETIKGLVNYGFYDEAIRVAETWLLGYTQYFLDHGALPEKLNALTGKRGEGGFYEGQEGFGWSVGNYLWILEELPKLYELRAANV